MKFIKYHKGNGKLSIGTRKRDRPMSTWDWCCTGALIIAVNVVMVALYILRA